MATGRLMASYDAAGASEVQGTASADRALCSYFDPITGEVIDLQTLADASAAMVSKDKLFAMQAGGELAGRLRPEPASAEWDHLVLDLTSYGERAPDAWSVIRDTLRKPSYQVKKNQGGGRFQDIDIKGTRGIVDWGVHTNRDDGLTHAHIFTHRYVVDTDAKRICPLTSMQTKMFANAEFECVNKALLAQGFAPLQSLDIGQSPSKVESMPRNEQHAVAEQGAAVALAGGDVMASLESGAAAAPAAPGIIGELRSQELLARGLDAAKQQAAQAAEQYKRASEAAAQMQVALEAIQARKQLEAVVATQTQTIAQRDAALVERAAELAAKNEMLASTNNELLATRDKLDEREKKIMQLDADVADRNQLLKEANDDYKSLESERDDVVKERNAIVISKNQLQEDFDAVSLSLTEEKELTEGLRGDLTGARDQVATLTSTIATERATHESERDSLREKLDAERAARDADRAAAEADRARLQAALDGERNAREADRQTAEAARNKVQASLDAERAAREADRGVFEKTIAQLTAAKDAIIDGLKQKFDELKSLLDGTKKELDAVKKQVTELQRPKPTEAALGRLDFTTVGGMKVAKAALAIMKDRLRGVAPDIEHGKLIHSDGYSEPEDGTILEDCEVGGKRIALVEVERTGDARQFRAVDITGYQGKDLTGKHVTVTDTNSLQDSHGNDLKMNTPTPKG